ELEVAADDLVPLRPERCPAGTPVAVIRIAGRMDAGDSLSIADEIEKGLLSCRRRRGIVRIVEEFTGRARQEDGVVLLEIVGGECRRVVGRVGRPRARFL